MGGRRGGDPVRRQGKQRGQTPWFAPSVRILAAIGKTTRPDLAGIGAAARHALTPRGPPLISNATTPNTGNGALHVSHGTETP